MIQKRSNKMPATVAEFQIEPGSSLIGKSQKSADIRKKVGVTVLGILRDNENIFNPEPDVCFNSNDKLLIFGTNEQVDAFRHYYGTT